MLFRPARASDMDEICALLATARHGPDYFHALFASDPGFAPQQFRLAWTGGRIVACAKIYPLALRIGTSVVWAGGIGNLRTDVRHWGQGLATSLLSECLGAMYLEGMSLAPLFATRHTLFARRGWHAMSRPELRIPVSALVAPSAEKSSTTVRPLEGHDLDAVMALHESANAARTGSVVRNRDAWLARLTALDLRGATPLVAEHDGELVGLLWVQPRDRCVEVLEMLLAPWAEWAWRPLLHAVRGRFKGATTLRAALPRDYRRLIRDALPGGAASATRDDLMLRMVDPVRLLQGLVPLLTTRLHDAADGAPLALRIGHLRGGSVLRVEGGPVVAAEHPRRDDEHALPEGVFLALLLGTEDAPAQLDAVPLPGEVRDTLLRLFPPQDWIYWPADEF